jgi:acyl-CoA synthetase (AMP-forming)/AMP-acid ligase II
MNKSVHFIIFLSENLGMIGIGGYALYSEKQRMFQRHNTGQQATSEEIMEYCREKLASYKKPAIVEFVDALPKNAMQKVLKNILRGETPK